MYNRRTFVVLSGASLLAGCSLPEVPPVEFQVKPDAAPRALSAFEEFAESYGYKARGPVEFADILASGDIDARAADYRGWRSEFFVARWTDEPQRFTATFQPAGFLALSYQDLGEIAADLARALRGVDGVLVDETYY